MKTPKISISSPTTYDTTIYEDIKNFSVAGATGIGLWEYKMNDGEDAKVLDAMKRAGLAASAVCGKVPSIIPDPFFLEPSDPAERTKELIKFVRRMAPFKPAAILVTTGEPGNYDLKEAREIVVKGIREVAKVAGDEGVILGLEPYRQTSGTLVTTLQETMDMIDEIGSPHVRILVDVWHTWDIPGIFDDLVKYIDQLVCVQISDYRNPTRNWCDRVLPGDGMIDLKGWFRTLDNAGFDGWYDVEIFSDDGRFGSPYPDSVWLRDPIEVANAAVRQTIEIWNARND